ncbi:Uncharacterized protein SCF082_LOCUS28746, partial [Durusdinium trenchii]
MQPHWAQSQAQWNHGYSTAPPYPQAWQGYQNHSNEQKGSCFDYGFCTEEQQNMAYEAMLSRLEEEGTFSSVTHDNGRLRINVPFAGRFAERKQLLPFLRREILEKRSEIREIHLFVTDVNDFYGAQEASGDPQIVLHFAVQDGRQPLPPADVVMGMHPDCSSSFLTSFWGYYQAYYYMWQEILRTALSSAPLAIFANLWLEESIEVQQVARHQGMAASHAIKNRPYYGHTVTAPLTSNCRDRQPFHYMVIAQREPGGESAKKIQAHAEDYTGPYQNQWTMYPYPHWPYG